MKKHIKDIAIIVVISLMLSLVFCYIFSFLAVYCVIPELMYIFPKLGDALYDMSKSGALINIAVDIGLFIGFLPALILVYRVLRDRREKFLEDTEGYISPRAGIAYGIKNYGKADAVAGGITLLLSFAPLPSPIRILYRLVGVIPGFIIGALYIAVCFVLAIKSAQGSWRATYFYNGK